MSIAMHDAMRDDVTKVRYLTTCMMVWKGKGVSSMNMPSYLFSLGLATKACENCSLVWLMWFVVMHRRLRSS